MKIIFTFLAIILMLSAGLHAQSWQPLGSQTPVPVKHQLQQTDDESIVIQFNLEGFFMKSVETPRGREYIISVPEMVSMLEEGAPDIPKYAVSAIIPDLDLMKVRILDYSYTDLPNMEVAPSKGNFPRSVDPESVPYTYGEPYDTDALFPALRAEMQEPYIFRDFRGQAVSVFPFAYNPQSKILRVFTELVIEIYSDGQGGENQFTRTHEVERMDREFKAIYESHFINYAENINRYIVEEEGNMLVISHGPFMEAMEPFIEWKTTIGRPIEMVNVADIGTNSTAIKSFITDYYNDNGLTHVLFVGDHQQVPSQSVSAGFSDSWYGFITGNDSYNELFVGRFSAETVAHVETQVQRTIEYERDLNETDDWLNVGIGIARNEGTGSGHYGEGDHTHMDFIRDSLLNFTYDIVHREYDGNVPGVPNTNAAQMMQRFNEGASITNFCNHGYMNGWSVGSFSSSHVNQLTNVGKLPYIWSVACDNGRFTSGTCFAEDWLRATHNGEPSGAIATMMSWMSQPWQPPMTGQDEMVTILVEKRDHIKRTMAGVSINGSMKMISMHGSSGINTHETWILFGDPSLMLRTDIPEPITVDHMPTAFLGFSEFTVNADADDALVSITMNGEILGTAYVDGGVAVVEFEEPLGEPGEMTIAITGWNRITYIETIEVIPAEGPFIAYSASLIDDTEGGNDDGQIDYNETITLGVELTNLGVEPATDVVATISTDSPYVTLIDDEQSYGIIEADEVVMIEDAFQFHVEDGVPNNTTIAFTIDIVGNEDTWSNTFNHIAYAPVFTIGNYSVNDEDGNDNGRLDPGETADLIITASNEGNSESVEAIGNLILDDPYVTLNNSSFEFGTFEQGQTLEATFNVTVAGNAPIGYAFGFDLELGAGAYGAEKSFTAKVGQILEDFESGDFSQFDWQFSGHQPWTIINMGAYEGVYAAKSGAITHNQQTRMILEYEVGTTDSISFYRRVSSESGYDYLRFYINNNKMGEWSGNVPWGKVSYPVMPGNHTFTWEYMKDPMVSSGADAAWVDYISFPAPVATTGGAGTDAAICESETHQLEGYATNYVSIEWTTSGTGTFSDPNIPDPVYTPGAEDIDNGEVTLTITVEGNNNTVSDDILLSIFKNPIVHAGTDAGVCNGLTFEVTEATADHAEALLWETTGTGEFDDPTALMPVYTPSAQDYEAGSVTLSLHAFGYATCGDAVSNITLAFHELPTATISGDQEICQGENAELLLELTGTAPWAVTLGDDMGTHSIPYSPYTLEMSPGTPVTCYLVMVVDNNGCEGEVSGEAHITMNYPPAEPMKPTGPDSIDYYEMTQTSYTIEAVENADMYEWMLSPAEAGTLTANDTELTIEWNTDYTGQAELWAHAGNECGMGDASAVLNIELYSTVGLSEFGISDIAIYPNPSDGIFTLVLNSTQKAEASIRVNNILGETVHAAVLQTETQTMRKVLNLSHLDNGTYILSIETNDSKITERIIIQR